MAAVVLGRHEEVLPEPFAVVAARLERAVTGGTHVGTLERTGDGLRFEVAPVRRRRPFARRSAVDLVGAVSPVPEGTRVAFELVASPVVEGRSWWNDRVTAVVLLAVGLSWVPAVARGERPGAVLAWPVLACFLALPFALWAVRPGAPPSSRRRAGRELERARAGLLGVFHPGGPTPEEDDDDDDVEELS